MKHPHYDKIVAKAANMDLVVFTRQGSKWNALNEFPAWNEDYEYFLCQPKHKEACLHWLNGGKVQVKNETYLDWVDCGSHDDDPQWYKDVWMMRELNEYRIKPRKEKRWIAYRKGFGDCAPRTFDSVESAKFWVNHNSEASEDYWAFAEIEVEV